MMKKILLLSLSLITLNSCDFPDPIPVEGCTDPNAINYNSNADTDNNSCDFTADILFYLNQDAGIFLYNQGVNKITFHINGNSIGSQYNNGGFSPQRPLQFVLMSFSQQDQFIGQKVVTIPSHGKL